MSVLNITVCMTDNVRCFTDESSCQVKTEADTADHPHDDISKPFLCTLCDKRFIAKRHLNDHVKRHTGKNWYTCTQCEKRFAYQSLLCRHMNMHAGKYKCAECGKCCRSGGELASHRRTHSGEKPFECFVCGKRFTTLSHLVEHNRTHSLDRS